MPGTLIKAGQLISVSGAARKLNVTRVTIYKWLSMGILKYQDHREIEGRHSYLFDGDYLDRIATILPKKRAVGSPLLNRKLEEQIKRM
jgi:hypothetical protein